MKTLFKATLLTGLLVGTTDFCAAIVSSWIKSGTFPAKIFHYIAGGAIGLERSMKGGIDIAFIGLFIHYFIAYSWTLLFFLIFPYVKFLSLNRYVVGFFYGVFVGLSMTFLVLPLTALPSNPFNPTGAIQGWIILGVVLGIPIAINAQKFYKETQTHVNSSN